ncbi:MAG: acyltransferase family protein [Lachnospiraceae bacterium]|nr:acyltransferase family protein [Lachnospiraceae bacterium]
MLIIVLMWLALVFWGIEYLKVPDGTAFDKENTLALRGICSIEIMMGHLGIATNSTVLFPNRKAGILFVGIFFAISGYGLMCSLHNKNNYLDRFLINRLPKLLIPAYVIYAIGIFAKAVFLNTAYGPADFFRPDRCFTGTNWYVWEMFVMYIVFYICARLMDLKKSHIVLLILSLIFVCIGYTLKLDGPWYGSTFCFWLGIFYFIKREKFREVLVLQHWILKTIICGVTMTAAMALFFINEDGIIGDLIGRNIASVSFVIIVIICLYRFKLGNMVSRKLGKYSYEIFLFHPILIAVLRPYIDNNAVYALLVIALTIIAASIYCIFSDFIREKMKQM